MADELIDIFTKNNEPTGITKMKNEAHATGLWHRVVHVWIYNSKNELLFQLRSKDKDLYPNVWDVSAAGHIGAGEDIELAAIREVKEELGISINPEDLQSHGVRPMEIRYENIINNEFFNIFSYKYNGDIKDLILQKEEVDDVKFIPFDTAKEELLTKPEKYVPGGEYWLEMIDLLKK